MTTDSIIKTLLKNRGLTSKSAISEFLNPVHPSKIRTPFDSKPAIRLIKSHIKAGNKIAIYGDYDVDGICSTAILWETIYSSYKNVFPHIPHRQSEGYGLSQKGIDHCLSQGAKLIIAVDNGIVAHSQIDYCRSQNCDIIIIDHHEPSETLPNPNVLLHSTSSCAAGLTWLFCRDYLGSCDKLELVTIATICDIVPLIGVNRSFAKYGLEELNRTSRPGLLALFEEAGISKIETYHVGFVIGPRLNAMGRLEHAIDSLRLLCTHNSTKAQELAMILGTTNKARQDATQTAVNHALQHVTTDNVIIAADTSYHPGIIGLIAAKLVEKHYRPTIAISIGESHSKASARSISGFHITNHIRTASHLLVNVGGHAMAAGFTIETSKLPEFISAISNPDISSDLLVRKTRVDIEIPLSSINYELTNQLTQFEPFGLGNPQPIFLTKKVEITSSRPVGKSNQHLKLQINGLDAIAFNTSNLPPNPVDITYSVSKDTYNGQSKLQLIIKDIKHHD